MARSQDPAKRIDSAGLLSHPFIKDDVALLRGSSAAGLEPIKELLASSLEQLAEYRRDDNKVEEIGDTADAEATLRAKGAGGEAAAAAAGTMVRRGGTNATGRSPRNTSGADGGGTLVRQHVRRTSPHDNGEAAEYDTGTMVRGPRGVSPTRPGVGGAHRRGASSDDHTGTLVRHRPSSRRNSREDAGTGDSNVEATGA